MIMDNGGKNKILEESQSMQDKDRLIEQLQQDKRIFDMLCHDFTAVYYIDLNTGRFTTLKLGPNTNAAALQLEEEAELENFDMYARQYGEKYIPAKDRKEFLAWFNCSNLKEKLLGRDVITYHYRLREFNKRMGK